MKLIAALPKAFISSSIIFIFFASWTSTVSARRFKRQNIDVTSSGDTPESSETSTLPTTTTTTTSTTTTSTTTTSTTTTTTSTTTTTTTRSSSTKSAIDSIIDDLGPYKEVDVVLVMSRARSIGKRVFYEHGRPVAFRLLRQYATVHPNFARVAFITYAFNSTVVYNGITDRSKAMDKCAMFPPVPDNNGTFPMDAVFFDMSDEELDCGLYDSIENAKSIFNSGRSSAKKIIIFLTNANINGVCRTFPIQMDGSIIRYVVKYGAFMDASRLDYILPTRSSYSDFIATWDNLLNQHPTNVIAGTAPLSTSVSYDVCNNLDIVKQKPNSQCYCDVHYGSVKRNCLSGYIEVIGDSNLVYCMNESIYGGQCSNQNKCGNGLLCYSAFKNNQLNYECQPLSTCENSDMGRYCENGICVPSQDNTGFSCICDIGHYGPFCRKRFDSCRFPNLCSENGFCENNNEKSFTCNCSTGYYGDFCLDKIVVTVGNITVKVTVPVEVMSPINRTAAIIGGSVVAGIIFIAIIVAILICIIVAVKRRQLLKKRNVVGMEMGTSTDNHGSVSKWSVKNKGKNNLTMRLSKLWNNKTLRGMPTVPSKMSGNMTHIDPQIVSQEETVLENEVIHDNRPVMESWNKYLENLVEKRVINKGLMANLQTREHMPTTDWMMDWGEVYTLDAQYNSDNSTITVQGFEFKLETMSDGLTCGWCIPADFDAKQKFMAVSKTKRYLIIGMVTIGPDVDGNECREEIKFIANHIKSEGF